MDCSRILHTGELKKAETRKCKIPLPGLKFFFQGRIKADLRDRLIKAGSEVVQSPHDAKIIVLQGGKKKDMSPDPSLSPAQTAMSMRTFYRLYESNLYSECERFKARPHVSPITRLPIRENGHAFKRWVEKCGVAAEQQQEHQHQKSSASRKKLIERIQRVCINDVDPITLDKFSDLSQDELKRVITIGDSRPPLGRKKHCYTRASALGLVQRAERDGKRVHNPLDPSYVFTASDIERIRRMNNLPSHAPINTHRPRPLPLARIRFLPETVKDVLLLRISICMPREEAGGEYEVYSMGYMPAEVTASMTGSVDLTSAVVMVTLNNLLDQAKLVTTHGVNPMLHDIRKPKKYWIGPGLVDKFKTLAASIERLS